MTGLIMRLTIYTDGGSRGNPGKAAFGYVIYDENKKILAQEGRYIGITTNNVAEYTALLEALKKAKELLRSMDVDQINCFADSNLIVQQLSGKFRIKAIHLQPIITQIRQLETELPKITYQHVPRTQNTKADSLVNQALDRQNP